MLGLPLALVRKFVRISFALSLTVPQVAGAVALADCTRTTHPSHGGEADHTDLTEGRVMWRDWWSHEGTATSFILVDCEPGTALTFRTQEERMTERAPFDRTSSALKIVEVHEAGARAFATFERMAADLSRVARDIDIKTLDQETCACAALYPEARGNKTEFKLAG